MFQIFKFQVNYGIESYKLCQVHTISFTSYVPSIFWTSQPPWDIGWICPSLTGCRCSKKNIFGAAATLVAQRYVRRRSVHGRICRSCTGNLIHSSKQLESGTWAWSMSVCWSLVFLQKTNIIFQSIWFKGLLPPKVRKNMDMRKLRVRVRMREPYTFVSDSDFMDLWNLWHGRLPSWRSISNPPNAHKALCKGSLWVIHQSLEKGLGHSCGGHRSPYFMPCLGKMEAWQWWGAKNPEDAVKDLGSGVALECVFGRICAKA